MDAKTEKKLRQLHKQFWAIVNGYQNGITVTFLGLPVIVTFEAESKSEVYIADADFELGKTKLSRHEKSFLLDCCEYLREYMEEHPVVSRTIDSLKERLEKIESQAGEMLESYHFLDFQNVNSLIKAIKGEAQEAKKKRREMFFKLKAEFEPLFKDSKLSLKEIGKIR